MIGKQKDPNAPTPLASRAKSRVRLGAPSDPLLTPRARAARRRLTAHLADPGVQVIITTGGTGITSRDSTYEVVAGLLQKRLDGFGELFRMLSFEQIGPAAMMSRACAGIAAGHIVVSLPGSEAAVRLAMERLLIPELGHLVEQAGR